jgi:ectoine hydroxylase-related dioxygenase (phytanoyl-CoA dioxygenase family)
MSADLRHPLNVDFTWTAPRPPFGFVTAEQAAAYDELGFFVLENAFDPAAVAKVVGEIDPIEHELEDLLRQADGGRIFIARADEITFTTHLVARSALLRELVASSPLVDICADLIGPDVRLYWDQAVYKKPGTTASFPWHQDNGYAFVEPQQYLTCWIALTDATQENGCPWVVPGLHKMGTLRHRASETGLVCFEKADGAVPAPVAAGGVVVFSSLTPHCTGPNQTGEVRKSYIVQYAPDGAAVIDPSLEVVAPALANDPERQFMVVVDGLPEGSRASHSADSQSFRAPAEPLLG